MTVIEILHAARALIARGWTQHTFALDENGLVVKPTMKAKCFCIGGAFRALGDCGDWARARCTLKECLPGYPPLVDWNDVPGRTQADVLELFDRAIAKLENP